MPLVLLLFSLFFHFALTARLTTLAKIEGNNKIGRMLEEAVYLSLGNRETDYSDLVSLRMKEDGSVAALESNLVACNLICAESLGHLLYRMKEVGRVACEIPIGNLSGVTLLSGKGAVCRVEFLFTGAGRARLESRFSEAGINQTRHEIRLVLEVDTLLLLPGREERGKATREIPLAETVIVGRVPDAYTEIHRLTDDITESEIDDIYDFGAG